MNRAVQALAILSLLIFPPIPLSARPATDFSSIDAAARREAARRGSGDKSLEPIKSAFNDLVDASMPIKGVGGAIYHLPELMESGDLAAWLHDVLDDRYD